MKKPQLIYIAFLFLLPLIRPSFALEDAIQKEKQKTFLKLTCFNLPDYSLDIVATLNIKIKNRFTPIENFSLDFTTVSQDTEKKLGSAITDEKGQAVLKINARHLPKDTTGNFIFIATFRGNDTLNSSSSEIGIQDIDFDLNIEEEDSVKIVTVTGYEISGSGEKIPLEGTEVHFYIKRLFGLLSITEEPVLLENGTGSIEFTMKVPGDTAGNIGIVARIEDHEIFGNVERMKIINWGVPAFPEPPEVFRAQWFTSYGLYWLVTIIALLVAYIIYRQFYASKNQ